MGRYPFLMPAVFGSSGCLPGVVEQLIVDRLQGKAIEPQAVVTVSKNISNTVAVAGEVVNGARVPLTLKGDRVLDVIASGAASALLPTNRSSGSRGETAP